jgi:hypothetical protein
MSTLMNQSSNIIPSSLYDECFGGADKTDKRYESFDAQRKRIQKEAADRRKQRELAEKQRYKSQIKPVTVAKPVPVPVPVPVKTISSTLGASYFAGLQQSQPKKVAPVVVDIEEDSAW